MQPQLQPITHKPNEDAWLTPAEFKALAARVQRNTYCNIALFILAILVYLFVGTISFLWSLWTGNLIFFGIGLAVSFGALLTKHLHARHVRPDDWDIERLIEFVTSTQDVNMLGPIIDLEETWVLPGNFHARIRPAIQAAVERLFPLAQAVNADGLNTFHRQRLRRYLYSMDYRLLMLSVLERIGDKRDLPDVEQLMKAEDTRDDIRAAAKHCAQAIRERVAREDSSNILLRPDRKPEAVATLLRPTDECAATPPQQLLRAATSDDGDMPA